MRSLELGCPVLHFNWRKRRAVLDVFLPLLHGKHGFCLRRCGNPGAEPIWST